MKILITGATGFVGERLLERLDSAVVLSRNAERAAKSLGDKVRCFGWSPQESPPPAEAFEGVDAVIHLAGDPVAEGRWTEKKKAEILSSRVVGTRNLVDGIAACETKPKVLVSASAVGFYGDRGDEVLDESSSSPEDDFLAQVCRGWEAEAKRVAEFGVRATQVRVGLVLGQGGGALSKMLTPFKLGVGGRLGSGKQWVPWIHRDDLVSMFLWAAENEAMQGPLNGTAPNPVTNLEFTKLLGKQLGRPTIFPAPKFALRLVLGEFANVLFASQRVIPKEPLANGFEFRFPELGAAFADILG